jgi:hypothetical protein
MKILFIMTAVVSSCFAFCLIISAGCGDDDDDSGDDDQAYDGTCVSFCEKVISCGDQSWGSVDDCAQNCDSAPKRDCYLTCDTTMSCGDFMDCLSGC